MSEVEIVHCETTIREFKREVKEFKGTVYDTLDVMAEKIRDLISQDETEEAKALIRRRDNLICDVLTITHNLHERFSKQYNRFEDWREPPRQEPEAA